ncbi:MAG: primosomal protein N' [Verrucomicrobia bacterium]|nr:primosomal protein N' [Verrucomicrobiota bacterium]MDA1065546.1 primosomal protein N' [Verrucomicrobiota bacterium]
MAVKIARVLPISGFEKLLDYRVPPTIENTLKLGCLVRIPIRNRHELGVVLEFPKTGQFPPEKLKQITQQVMKYPALTSDSTKLMHWMHDYYGAGYESILETFIPAAVRKGMGQKLEKQIVINGPFSADEFDKLNKRARKQAVAYQFLRDQIKPLKKSLVVKRLRTSASVIDGLIEKGLVKEVSEVIERTAYDDELSEEEEVEDQVFDLTEEQTRCVASIEKSIQAKKFQVHLLHGVTGSGKTEIYLRAIASVIKAGKTVIFLVPEVALTPQTVSRLRGRFDRFDFKTVVWHSHLSSGERLDAWTSLAAGEAKVVVGARSALFAPLANVGLIIVDEEHEPAYKQEETPRYHARDVAVYRSKLANAVCVLGSATPSLESLYNVSTKKYISDRLFKRVDNRLMPTVHVVDMRQEFISQKGAVTLSRRLVNDLRDRLEKKEQSILFINRRGYSRSMICPECGWVGMCKHCSIPMTFHRKAGKLVCHLCAAEEQAHHRCPECRSSKIKWQGTGTQKVEEVIKQVLPHAVVVRIDADSMQKKNLFRKILGDFRRGRIDILVGTQMIAKGLDFPNVTLVGLIDADISMHVPDFRAHERTFQLLVQVAGRAGRGDLSGEVLVQSFTPSAGPIQYARREDFDGFLEEELQTRKEHQYPPYRNLIHHMFRGMNPEKVAFYAEQWVKHLEKSDLNWLEIRGPVPAPIEKIKDYYRYQVWYFTKNVSKTMPALLQLREKFPMSEDVIDVFDVNPVNLV